MDQLGCLVWVDRQSQLIQVANRKVVLVIFTKEQKSYVTLRYVTVRYGELLRSLIPIEKKTIYVGA